MQKTNNSRHSAVRTSAAPKKTKEKPKGGKERKMENWQKWDMEREKYEFEKGKRKKTYKFWDMTNGEEFEGEAKGIEEFTEETPWSIIEILENHYDAMKEKWFYYIRIRNKEKPYRAKIYQVTLKE